MRRPVLLLGTLAILVGLLGCRGSSDAIPPPPAYTLDLQPGDATIPPSGVAIFYIATLRQDGQAVAYQATPQWSFVDGPPYSVGTLTPVPDSVGTPDPVKRSCYYQPPGSLPQGVSRVSYKVRVQVQVGGQSVEAFRNLTLDVNAVLPPAAPPTEGAGKSVDSGS
jgi:hypothetical protein